MSLCVLHQQEAVFGVFYLTKHSSHFMSQIRVLSAGCRSWFLSVSLVLSQPQPPETHEPASHCVSARLQAPIISIISSSSVPKSVDLNILVVPQRASCINERCISCLDPADLVLVASCRIN